ncbi:MAG TPA: extensin family protein [Labilithrix sp.]|nr:extensin family protein [Labilithrix sp.]
MGSRRRPLSVLSLALPLLCGSCHLLAPARPPERPTSTEIFPPTVTEPQGGDTVGVKDVATGGEEEAAAVPSATSQGDEPSDATPGEGVPEPLSLAHAHGNLPVASRYARLDRASCEAELGRRHISYERVPEARGVIAPLRLTGTLSGVRFRSNLPAAKSRTSPYDIYDCRLVLALDDFARLLEKHGIVEVVHLSVYRPVSSKVVLKGAGRRHSGALAIDAALFKTKDGRTLSVEKDFSPRRIGARPCPAPPSASELRKIACEAHAARLFNVLLTPDYNRAHRNHFHMEVTAGVRWTLVR